MRHGLVRWGLLVVLTLAAIVTPADLISLSLSPSRDLDLGSAGGTRPVAVGVPAPEEGPSLVGPAPGTVNESAPDPAEAGPAPEEEEITAAGEPERVEAERPSFVPGRIVALRPDPDASFEVAADGSIKFTAILVNQGEEGLKLTGELIVIKGDGTTETLLAPRALRLKAGQRLQLPVELAVRTWGFPPGDVEFLAILRDLQGTIVDRASVSFKITVALEH